MHFHLNGTDYRLGFKYVASTVASQQIHRRGDVKTTFIEEWTKHDAHALLFEKVAGPDLSKPPLEGEPPRPFHWNVVAMTKTSCSKLDRFSRVKGREIALGRLTHPKWGLSREMAKAVQDAYASRIPTLPPIEVHERPAVSFNVQDTPNL